MKPKIAPTVPYLFSFEVLPDGINSSTMTYNIAPAANPKINGNIGFINITRIAPITALIGSTIPLACP